MTHLPPIGFSLKRRHPLLNVGVAGTLCVVLLAGEAQSADKVHRIGFLSPAGAEPLHAFRETMREFGYVEGQNLVLVDRLAAGRLDQVPAFAAELVAARVDVIVAVSPPAIQAAKDVTTTIPIVMASTSIDPVQSGFVQSLARPGRNITGVAMLADEIAGKRLAMLKEMLPRATRIAVLSQANHSASVGQVKAARQMATSLGLELREVVVRDARDYEDAFTAASSAHGLFIVANPTFYDDRSLLATLAKKHRVASLCEWREMAEAGCLMAYGPNLRDLQRRAARYVDQIVRGARPADLPVEQPTTFELTISSSTVKALGLAVPHSLVLQAKMIP